MKLLFKITVVTTIIIIILLLLKCRKQTHTIIIKIKDEIQITSDNNNKYSKFPIEYFKKQESIKDVYLDSLVKIDLNQINFIADLLFKKDMFGFSPVAYVEKPNPLSWIKEVLNQFNQSPTINSIAPLFSNFNDVENVISAVALNNQDKKYVFTNLFNYLTIEFEEENSRDVEKILNNYLYDNELNLQKNIEQNKTIEYYYYPSEVAVAQCSGSNGPGSTMYKAPNQLNINNIPTWGTGAKVNITDFDDVAVNHSERVEGVLLGAKNGTNSVVSGLVPQANLMMVSHRSSSLPHTEQYNQFLHALSSSLNTSKKVVRPILLIEVHDVLPSNKLVQLPLETDPAMFYLIRIGAFGLNLIIPEVAGNGGFNLDSLAPSYLSVTNQPLSEFNVFEKSRRTLLGISSFQVSSNNATLEEISQNVNFNTNSRGIGGTNSTWLPIWQTSPSGAVLVAGYEKSDTNFNCRTNYGSKVKIIGPGLGVASCIKNSTGSWEAASFSCSSAATAVITGVIASALSKNNTLTAGRIKSELYGHTPKSVIVYPTYSSSITPACTLRVPNVQNFYGQLGLLPSAP